MPTNSKAGVGHIKSFTNKKNGVTYNSLRYKAFPTVILPNGPKLSRAVQQAAKEALAKYQRQEAEAPAQAKKPRGTTFGDALGRYFDSKAFAALRASTQTKRRCTLNKLARDCGSFILADITRANIKGMIAANEDKPAAARNILIALRHFFGERVRTGVLHEDKDPTLAIKIDREISRRYGTYPTWEQAHVDAFRAKWGPETMERLAFEVMLLTGMAVADAIRFQRSWIGKDAVIRFQRRKTSTEARPVFLRELRAAVEACPLATPEDRPFEPILRDQVGRIWYTPGKLPSAKLDDAGWRNADFSQWFTKACRAAGLPEGIAAHGVRKRAACDAALAGKTGKQMMAKFGWKTMEEVVLYTQMAENERFALEEAAADAAE